MLVGLGFPKMLKYLLPLCLLNARPWESSKNLPRCFSNNEQGHLYCQLRDVAASIFQLQDHHEGTGLRVSVWTLFTSRPVPLKLKYTGLDVLM